MHTSNEDQDKTERELIAELKYRSLFENAVMGIFQTTPDGTFISANQALARMHGYDAPEELLQTINNIEVQLYVNPSDRERLKMIHREQGSVSDFEVEMFRKDGSTFWMSMSARAVRDGDGNIVFYEGTAQDITKRKGAENALLKNEETLKALINATQESLLLIDPQGIVLTINEVAAQRLGSSVQEMTGRYLFDYFSPELARSRREQFGKVMRTGQPSRFKDHREGKHFEIFAFPAYNRERKVSAIAIFAMDITERERMEQALRESENKFRDLAEKSAVGVYLIQDGIFRYVNKKFAEIKGYGAEEMVHKMGPRDTTLPEDFPAAKETARKIITGEIASPGFEFREVTKDQKIRNVEAHVASTIYKGRRALIGTVIDVTERKKMEAEIIKMRNLESIGILAGGIAHDFNNLLMVIGGYVSLASMSVLERNDARTYLKHAEQGLVSATELTQKLITFSEGGAPVQQKRLNLNTVIRAACSSVLDGRNYSGEYFLSDGLFSIIADEGQLKQVFANIVRNAEEAMTGGGAITIRTANETLAQGCRIPLPPGDYVRASIIDHGMGIPAEDIPKIFDPYFTTKDRCMDKGMGLGLAVAYSIIKRHRGFIAAESVPGVRTVFDVYLPAAGQQS